MTQHQTNATPTTATTQTMATTPAPKDGITLADITPSGSDAITWLLVLIGWYVTDKFNRIIANKNNRIESIDRRLSKIQELSLGYWLIDEANPAAQQLSISLNLELDDLEDFATTNNLKLTAEIGKLRGILTGSDFEVETRKALDRNHSRFTESRHVMATIRQIITKA